MPNRLEDVNVEEVSLVDEAATGKRFLIFKRKMLERLKRKFRLRKDEEREDLYLLKRPEPLEEEGSYRVFIGFSDTEGIPSDEQLKMYAEKKLKDMKVGEKVVDFEFDAAEQIDDKPAYIKGVIWTKEREKPKEQPAIPSMGTMGAMGGGSSFVPEFGLTQAPTMASMPTGEGPVKARKRSEVLADKLEKYYAGLDNDPDVMEYALELAEEMGHSGIVDEWTQIEIYEMCMERFGARSVTGPEKWLKDLKWYAVLAGLSYLIFKGGERKGAVV